MSSITGAGNSDFREMQMNNLKNGGTSRAGETSGNKGASWNAVFEEESSSMVSVDDFLNLMVAQLRNQDFMNPVDDTQYVTQLAQFATMQQMQEMGAHMKSNYALTLVGKNVTAAKFTPTGGLKKETGIISKISLVDNSYEVTVNGETFKLEQIMELHSSVNQQQPSENLDYLMSLMSKEVTVKTKNDKGEEVKITGVVEKISVSGGKHQVMVDGKWYNASDVTEVGNKGKEDTNAEVDKTPETDSSKPEKPETDSAETTQPETNGTEKTEGSGN